jgi:hypothetical protein
MLTKILPVTLLTAALSVSTVALPTQLVSSSPKPADKPVAKPRKEGTGAGLDGARAVSVELHGRDAEINKAVSINLGNGATVCFDTEMCKLARGWTGGTSGFRLAGSEGMPSPMERIMRQTRHQRRAQFWRGSRGHRVHHAGPGWADADGIFRTVVGIQRQKYGPLPKGTRSGRGFIWMGTKSCWVTRWRKASVLEKDSFDPRRERIQAHIATDSKHLEATIICEERTGDNDRPRCRDYQSRRSYDPHRR